MIDAVSQAEVLISDQERLVVLVLVIVNCVVVPVDLYRTVA